MTSIALIVASWAVVSVLVAFCVGYMIKMADLRSPDRTPVAAARPDAFFGAPSGAGSGLRTAG